MSYSNSQIALHFGLAIFFFTTFVQSNVQITTGEVLIHLSIFHAILPFLITTDLNFSVWQLTWEKQSNFFQLRMSPVHYEYQCLKMQTDPHHLQKAKIRPWCYQTSHDDVDLEVPSSSEWSHLYTIVGLLQKKNCANQTISF